MNDAEVRALLEGKEGARVRIKHVDADSDFHDGVYVERFSADPPFAFAYRGPEEGYITHVRVFPIEQFLVKPEGDSFEVIYHASWRHTHFSTNPHMRREATDARERHIARYRRLDAMLTNVGL